MRGSSPSARLGMTARSLRHLRHALSIEPDFADAFNARQHVIDGLAADPHQLCPDDAPDEITLKLVNFLRRGALQSLAKNRRHGAGKRSHFRTERHRSACAAVFLPVPLNPTCAPASLLHP